MEDFFVKLGDLDVKLLEGEYHRFRPNDARGGNFYLCLGLVGENKILFQYVDTLNQPKDYVQEVLNNIPEIALKYLVKVLNTYKYV